MKSLTLWYSRVPGQFSVSGVISVPVAAFMRRMLTDQLSSLSSCCCAGSTSPHRSIELTVQHCHLVLPTTSWGKLYLYFSSLGRRISFAIATHKFHAYVPNTLTQLEAKPSRELADAPRSGAGWVD